MADSDTLRSYLGERYSAPETADDTFFSDAEIDALVADSPSLYAAAAEGWLQKAGEAAMQVNTSEGGSSRQMSDIHKHALTQYALFKKLADEAETGSASPRSRVHTLGRP